MRTLHILQSQTWKAKPNLTERAKAKAWQRPFLSFLVAKRVKQLSTFPFLLLWFDIVRSKGWLSSAKSESWLCSSCETETLNVRRHWVHFNGSWASATRQLYQYKFNRSIPKCGSLVKSVKPHRFVCASLQRHTFRNRHPAQPNSAKLSMSMRRHGFVFFSDSFRPRPSAMKGIDTLIQNTDCNIGVQLLGRYQDAARIN